MPARYFEDLSLTPFKKDLAGYTLSTLRSDLTAALTVMLLTIPQAMAYALVAGLPLYCGIYAAIFAPMVAALFGSSRHLVVGPSNAVAILIQAGTAEILTFYYGNLSVAERGAEAVVIVTALTFLVGLIQLFAAGFRLGQLTQFISYSVVIGYVVGVAVAILIGQLYILFGIPELLGVHSIFMKGYHLITAVHKANLLIATIGLFSLFLIWSLRRINTKVPAAVIAFFVSALIAYFLQHQMGYTIPLIGTAGNLTGLHPTFAFPHFDFQIMNQLLSMAFAVALLCILETSSVAKAISASTGQRLSTNQEMLSLGLGNITSAFVSGMPISGSTSRSMLNLESGAKTRMAGILSAFFVGVLLFFFGNFVTMIPQAALAALLVYTSFQLIDKRQLLLCLKSTNSDAMVFWITFLSTLFFNLDTAFYIGVMLSITLYLKKAAAPQLQQFTFDEEYTLISLDNVKKEVEVPIRVIKVKGELFFGAADLFQSTLKAIAGKQSSTKVIILHLKNARDIDATACLALRQLAEFLQSTNRHLICSGLPIQIWEVMSGSGLVELIGKENLFLLEDSNTKLSMHRAMDRANELLREDEEAEEDADSGDEEAPILYIASGEEVEA